MENKACIVPACDYVDQYYNHGDNEFTCFLRDQKPHHMPTIIWESICPMLRRGYITTGVVFIGAGFGQGKETNEDLVNVSLECTPHMMDVWGGEPHHATMEYASRIFINDVQGQDRAGTMACPVLHFDKRCKNMQHTGSKG